MSDASIVEPVRHAAYVPTQSRRSERRPSKLLLDDLTAIGELAGELEVRSEKVDFDFGWTTDDMRA
ncbi:MAG TPA: hypothetical protein VGG98_11460 [Solirubrobacteraceae bacterium]|jgi:hypothetical protein